MLRSTLFLAGLSAAAAFGYCNDRDASCAAWGRNGECEGDNKDHVKAICPHTCGTCNFVCGDLEEACAAWAKEGECETSPAYMHKNCPTACGFCSPKCADLHEDCNHWKKEGQCEENRDFMNLNCAVS